MPLRIYLKNDGKTTSSISAIGKTAKRVIRPTRGDASRIVIYTLECRDHTPPHPTITADLFMFAGKGIPPQKVGSGRACPLCWELLSTDIDPSLVPVLENKVSQNEIS